MSKNLNSELKKEESYTCDPSSVGSRDRRVRCDVNHMGRGMQTIQITLIICYQIVWYKFFWHVMLCWDEINNKLHDIVVALIREAVL
jgi:hypothetical protein